MVKRQNLVVLFGRPTKKVSPRRRVVKRTDQILATGKRAMNEQQNPSAGDGRSVIANLAVLDLPDALSGCQPVVQFAQFLANPVRISTCQSPESSSHGRSVLYSPAIHRGMSVLYHLEKRLSLGPPGRFVHASSSAKSLTKW